MGTAKVAIAQLNLCVGDLAGNANRLLQAARTAHEQGADVMVAPELALTGYPPEDLLLRPLFVERTGQALAGLQRDLAAFSGLHVVVGHVLERAGRLYNAASVLLEGRLLGTYCKLELPNYSVFDEQRYFVADGTPFSFEVKGVRFAVNICEDAWFDRAPALAAGQRAHVLLVPNASPFNLGKQAQRAEVMSHCVRTAGCATVYANMTGGQDELVFDGASFVLDAQGRMAVRLPDFAEAVQTFEVSADGSVSAQPDGQPAPAAEMSAEEVQVWQALTMGVRDYLGKNGFPGAIIGLSGGIDSALVLAIAVEALGADKVRAVMMPSPYTADISLADARAMAEGLGVRYDEIAIEPMMGAFGQALAPQFAGLPEDATEENIQARIRGTLLMALSNKSGKLVLTTGNKSELSTGYCTLYGDMAGGYAAIKDVPKTLVYRLARWRNAQSPVIPERIITRPASAELRPDQTDQDTLPPYEVLDAVMERYMEDNQSIADIVAAGYPADAVEQVVRLLRINEYKRRQAPPGPRITPRAFGRDWRYPVTNGFRESTRAQ